mmetsp:Transcript_71246/g.221013  ORF Transcript_71246/g.221013 Transcript_71246/m.221013 type:complete len:293 (-) Transcript_71246:102-980(-)
MAQSQALRAAAVLCLGLRGGLSLDAEALVQGQVRLHAATEATMGSGLLHSRLGQVLGAAQAPQLPAQPKPFDCAKYPFMCEAPFNCQRPLTMFQQTRQFSRLAAADGHANMRSWCENPQYADVIVQACIHEKNPKKAAHLTFEATKAGRFGDSQDLDASYCFMKGHCSNTEVTENTTVEEAEKMCDKRFGHDAWAVNFGTGDLQRAMLDHSAQGANNKAGFRNTAAPTAFAKAACATGNYHCDVIYCKQKICNDPMWRGPFGHLAWWEPGEHWKGIIDKPSFRSDAVAAYKK